MTDAERWEIEGRTRDALKQSKKTLALLRADISEHAQKLKEASEALLNFLSSPSGIGPTGMSKSEYHLQFFGTFSPPDIREKIKEFTAESERMAELEKQVSQF
jgi:hypothetical protein